MVYIPALLRGLTGGEPAAEVDAASVREVIDKLDERWPGLRERLLDGERLRPNLSVAVDGEISTLGAAEPVQPGSEVHFVAAIRGGRAIRTRLPLRT